MSYVRKLEPSQQEDWSIKVVKKGRRKKTVYFQAVSEREAMERACMAVESIEKERPETEERSTALSKSIAQETPRNRLTQPDCFINQSKFCGRREAIFLFQLLKTTCKSVLFLQLEL